MKTNVRVLGYSAVLKYSSDYMWGQIISIKIRETAILTLQRISGYSRRKSFSREGMFSEISTHTMIKGRLKFYMKIVYIANLPLETFDKAITYFKVIRGKKSY